MKRKRDDVTFTPPSSKRIKTSKIKLTKIRIYPIKSCKSISLSCINIKNGKLKYDRYWTLYDQSTNSILTQKNCPDLTKIQPFINKGVLSILLPNEKNVYVVKRPKNPLVRENVIFREKMISCYDMGDEVAKYLSVFLNREVRLLENMNNNRNIVASINNDIDDKAISFSYFGDKKMNPNNKIVADLNFSNRTPICIISEESVDFINNQTDAIVPEENYRVNFVISSKGDNAGMSTEEPFFEDKLGLFSINNVSFQFIRGAPRRCPMTGIDQKSGVLNEKILKVLMDKRGDKVHGKYADIGALCCCLIGKENGIVSVGDSIIKH